MTTVIKEGVGETTPPEGAQTYKWEELSQTAKDRAREEYVESLAYPWWDDVYEMAKEDGYEKGFVIENIYFSGFCSQGDGACWEGHVDICAWLRAHAPDTIGVDALIALFHGGYIHKHMGVKLGKGHYFHEGMMTFDYLEMDNGVADPDELDWAELSSFTHEGQGAPILKGMTYANIVTLNTSDEANPYKVSNIHKLEEDIEESARDYAKRIYKQLQEEYEYLTSEEAVGEFYTDNDFTFTEEGELA